MAKDWISGAIKKPGALRATAKRDGMIKDDGPLTVEDIGKLKKSKNPTTKKRADLAKTLMNMHGSKK